MQQAASATFPAQIGSTSNSKRMRLLHYSFLSENGHMLVSPRGMRVLKAALLLTLLMCCAEVALVGSIRLFFAIVFHSKWHRSSRVFSSFVVDLRSFPDSHPCLQASQDCANFEYNFVLLKAAGFEESLLVHIRRAINASAISSGDIVDFTACIVTLRGLTGRSNGRFAPYHIGPYSNHNQHPPPPLPDPSQLTRFCRRLSVSVFT